MTALYGHAFRWGYRLGRSLEAALWPIAMAAVLLTPRLRRIWLWRRRRQRTTTS